MSNIITILTDFGFAYTASMKGKILGINPDAKIVDISHKVSRHNILEGAFILKSVVRHFPPAIHIGVVDPGVGTGRRGIIIKSGDSFFIGPDNGLLIPAAREKGRPEIYQITREFPDASPTFHGRDIFAPIAAYLSLGKHPEEFGRRTDEHVDLNLEDFRVEGNAIHGKVVYVDDFGNVITNIPYSEVKEILKYGQSVAIFGKVMPFCRTYGDVAKGHPLMVVGSHGSLEISVNQGSAAEFFNMRAGDALWVKVVK